MTRSVRIAVLIVLAMLALIPGFGGGEAGVQMESERGRTGTIVAMGDSLTAGYGISEDQAYPAQLERKLMADGENYRVVNAGVSGETSSGALSRTNWVLRMNPDIVILETGANDGLRGVDPGLTKNNLEAIVEAMRARGVTVVLAGMRMVWNLGWEYTGAFNAIYPSVAQGRDIILEPFFLDGVAGKPDLNIEDGIHPNAKGYAIVTANIYPYVIDAIRRTGAGPSK